jgi:hypothetical protein
VCRHRTSLALALHNLSDEEVEVELDLDIDGPRPLIEMLSDRAYPRLEDGPVRLAAYGYRWLRCHEFPA